MSLLRDRANILPEKILAEICLQKDNFPPEFSRLSVSLTPLAKGQFSSIPLQEIEKG